MCCRSVHEVANSAYLSRFLFSALPSVAPYCVLGGVRVVSGDRGLEVAESSAVPTAPFPTSASLRLFELLRVPLVASFLQRSGSRVEHERYGRLVGVVADAVPLALGDEHSVALL